MDVRFCVMVLAFVGVSLAVKPWWDDTPYIQQPIAATCDLAYCTTPCPGKGMPLKCPTRYSNCSSGCACIRYCDSLEHTTCYETEGCDKRIAEYDPHKLSAAAGKIKRRRRIRN